MDKLLARKKEHFFLTPYSKREVAGSSRRKMKASAFVAPIAASCFLFLSFFVRFHQRGPLHSQHSRRSPWPTAQTAPLGSPAAVPSLETRVACDGGACCDGLYINRSCAWTNLYFYEKTFHALVLNASALSYDLHAVASGIRQFPQQLSVHPVFFPSITAFDNEEALAAFTSRFKPLTGPHIIISGGAHFNPAHAILDEVYSAWLCACKFNLDAERLVALSLDTGLTDSADPTHVGISRTFLGDLLFVRDWGPDAAFRFDLALAGVGQMGLSTPGSDYVMPGRRFDALRKMRNRFYRAYGHPPPLARASSRRQGPLSVLLVPNRRPSHGILTPDMIPLLSAAGFQALYLDFGQLSYGERLPLFREADIMVTGVGTGAMNAVFLSDGAVIVNLGTTERSGSLSFQEVSFTFDGDPHAQHNAMVSRNIFLRPCTGRASCTPRTTSSAGSRRPWPWTLSARRRA
jgi:hypothetical protein